LYEAAERGIAIKILIQADDDMIVETISEKIRHKHLPIDIQCIIKPYYLSKMGIMNI
jgi:hypothetical protein